MTQEQSQPKVKLVEKPSDYVIIHFAHPMYPEAHETTVVYYPVLFGDGPQIDEHATFIRRLGGNEVLRLLRERLSF